MIKRYFQQLQAKLKVEQPALELKQFELFSKMNEAELKIIHELMFAREYTAGEKLYAAGYPMELIFFIQTGEIELSENGELLRSLSAGDVLGFKDLDGSGKRSHKAIAKSEVKLLALSARDLRELRKNPGQLAARLNAAIEAELKKLAERDNGETESELV
ncbi:MAG: cyclic nucleotide-binding domain-containing protein [Candidatus Cloacimonetes bacterium]|nr:cyclic nucleotide-binding domain-containing protein [Candidatus Cloacimonadota bacterium]